jgi:GlpG protein
MRLAGTLNDEQLAQRFWHYLRDCKIDCRVEPQRNINADLTANISKPAVWEIWIRNDDQWREAQNELAEFVKDPQQEKFARSQPIVATVVETAARATSRPYNIYDTSQYRYAPWISWFCMMLCMAVYMVISNEDASTAYEKQRVADQEQRLLYEPATSPPDVPFAAIRKGEVWRILTPAILHGGFLHLFMNMMVLMSQGTQIERIRGPAVFGGLVLVLAAFSNTSQYIVNLLYKSPLPGNFVGISGVLFGLFGYRLAKSRWEPRMGIFVMEQEVVFMLCWLLLGVLDLFPEVRMANTAHISGWIGGMALAYLGMLWKRRTGFAQ